MVTKKGFIKRFLDYLRISAIIGERKSVWVSAACVMLAMWGVFA